MAKVQEAEYLQDISLYAFYRKIQGTFGGLCELQILFGLAIWSVLINPRRITRSILS